MTYRLGLLCEYLHIYLPVLVLFHYYFFYIFWLKCLANWRSMYIIHNNANLKNVANRLFYNPSANVGQVRAHYCVLNSPRMSEHSFIGCALTLRGQGRLVAVAMATAERNRDNVNIPLSAELMLG